jgi:hypothetical protein
MADKSAIEWTDATRLGIQSPAAQKSVQVATVATHRDFQNVLEECLVIHFKAVSI